MALVFRTAGPWGPGKGSVLSKVEGDTNIYELHTRVTAVEAAIPAAAVGIDHFVIEGALLTIVMTNGIEHGPFVLPVAQWRWTGDWEPDTQYFVGDIVEHESSIYFIRVQHISAATFDPGLFTVDGFVYILILAKAAQPYDIGLFYNDLLPAGETIIALHVVDRAMSIAANFAGAQAFLITATADSPITLPIYHNGIVVGTITFTPGEELEDGGPGQFGVFATVNPSAGFSLAVRDRLAIALPYEDDPAAFGLAVTIPAIVAAL